MANLMQNHEGEVLRVLRIANDLSGADMARMNGYSRAYIAELEKGKSSSVFN